MKMNCVCRHLIRPNFLFQSDNVDRKTTFKVSQAGEREKSQHTYVFFNGNCMTSIFP